MDSDLDDNPQLPADTLQALRDFYDESDARQREFEDLKAKAEAEAESADSNISIEAFAEDWNASQFWYSDETAVTLAKELLKDATQETAIAVVSAPSVFVQLKKLLASSNSKYIPFLRLFEYDDRFGVFKEFVKYDFNEPLRLPLELKGRFSHVICDPPFLSEECQTSTALTARWLSASNSKISKPRFILCTGAVMRPLVARLYAKEGVGTTTFVPKHSKGLSNEFSCYANFECQSWQFSREI